MTRYLVGLILAAVLAVTASGALAAPLTFNETPVDSTQLKARSFNNCSVAFDTVGNIRVSCPNYKLQLAPTTTATQPTTVPVQPAVQPAVQPGVQTNPMLPATNPNAVPDGIFWLVSEDLGSTGHIVDVTVNGTNVATITSGSDQVIKDLGQYLQRGTNQIIFTARPAASLGGGKLFIYISPGSNDNGVVNIGTPQIEYSRNSAANTAGDSKSFQLIVN